MAWAHNGGTYPENVLTCFLDNVVDQGDQIGRNFAIWAIFYGIGQKFY